ncbi:hypothetical protein KM043_015408 [Ampulex compressa]|nr:hypothetical protein KM043_015408 [Ampulex compressa]
MTQSQQEIDGLYESYVKTAANIVVHYEPDERKKLLEELRDIVKNHCVLRTKLKAADDIKCRIENLYDANADNDLEAILKEYKNGISEIRTDVSNDEKLLEFDRQVTTLLQGTEKDDDELDNDEDIQLSGGYINVIDPISKKRITDPVKNAICGHTYDRESVTEMLKINKKTRCPVIGCKSKEYITLAQLKNDIATRNVIIAFIFALLPVDYVKTQAMFIPTFILPFLVFSRVISCQSLEGHNAADDHSDPFLAVSHHTEEEPNYDISFWVQQLHLQQCAFVEIGENLCALFVELRSTPSSSKLMESIDVGEFFLGLCSCILLHSWVLCSVEVRSKRRFECSFTEGTAYANTSARVHRRLCDVTLLSTNAPSCNCSIRLAGQRLYETKGFPTCFLSPLPESLCSPRGVCGISQCSATTIRGIHSPQCSSMCYQSQPFCEEIGPWTSIPPAINSVWSSWSPPRCNSTCGKGLIAVTAFCYDQVTRKPATDCLGPGSFCCPDGFEKCSCEVTSVDGIMRATRFTEPCISTEDCASSNDRTFTFKRDPERTGNIEFDDAYNDPRAPIEDIERSPWTRPSRRLLQAAYRNGEYGLAEGRSAYRGSDRNRGYRSAVRSGVEEDADYEVEEEENNEAEDGEGTEAAEEVEEEDGEEETVNDAETPTQYYDYEPPGESDAARDVSNICITSIMIFVALNSMKILLR